MTEIVRDGENGLLVPPEDPRGARAPRSGATSATPTSASGSARPAPPSVERFSPERIYGRLEELLRETAGA